MAVKANYMQSSAVFSVFAITTQICELDGKILSGARSVYNHNKLHLNDEHECSICKKSFATLEYLSKHKKMSIRKQHIIAMNVKSHSN